MSYGLGQTQNELVDMAEQWGRVEAQAYRAVGSIWRTYATNTAALRALTKTIARAQALYWLAQPPIRHREGLLAIAAYAKLARQAAVARAARMPGSMRINDFRAYV